MDQARVVKPRAHINKTHVLFFTTHQREIITEFMLHFFVCAGGVCVVKHVYVSPAVMTQSSIKCSHSGKDDEES